MAVVERNFHPDVNEDEVSLDTGDYYWHLKDDNNEIICQGEGHGTKEAVQRAVDNVAYEFTQLMIERIVASSGSRALGVEEIAAVGLKVHIPIIDVE